MGSNNAITVGDRFRNVRTMLGLSVAAVATALVKFNVTEKEILEYENDTRPNLIEHMTGRDYELVNWYPDVFNCSPDYLMGKSDYPFGVPVRVRLNEKLDKLTDAQIEQLLTFVNLYYADSTAE